MDSIAEKTKKVTIAVDAMGGDLAPAEIVRGAAQVTLDSPIHILLVGNEKRIKEILKNTKYNASLLDIVHTGESITNDDIPKEVIRRKKNASMVLAAKLCGEGVANGMVSAGNTGAYVLSAVRHIPRVKGIHKTAIASVYPTYNAQNRSDIFGLLLDIGANVHSSSKDMVYFAIMGKNYVSGIKGIPNPTVALLNIGREKHKGDEKLIDAYTMLESLPNINFIGNIEGNELIKGIADVVVTDGFVGNIVMKTFEGIAEAASHLGKYAFRRKLLWKLGLIALSGGIRYLKRATDYSEYGGAPLLGFQEIVIKAHGRSKAKAITNAIKLAAKSYVDNVCQNISDEIEQLNLQFAFKPV